VANDVSQPDSGFAADTNEVTLVTADSEPVALPLLSKDEVADRILDWLVLRLKTETGGAADA